MTFVVPEGLAPEVYPLAWMVGSWRGEGVLGYPGVAESAFTAEIDVAADGGPYLSWSSRWRLVAAPDAPEVPGALDARAPVWAAECGWWRVPPVDPEAGTAGSPVELLVADPSGHVAVYLGRVTGPRLEVASDLVARTASGADVTAGRRMFGLVEGDLLWAFDVAAFGHPLQSYASARMRRVQP